MVYPTDPPRGRWRVTAECSVARAGSRQCQHVRFLPPSRDDTRSSLHFLDPAPSTPDEHPQPKSGDRIQPLANLESNILRQSL